MFALAIACQGPTPKDVLDDYKAALEKRDAFTLHSLSDADARRAYSAQELAARVQEDTQALDRVAELLEGALEVKQSARVQLRDGRVLLLIKEGSDWKIAQGGVGLERYDTPEHALDAFFRAVSTGRLRIVRKVIPERFEARFSNDQALVDHLLRISPRIEQARTRLGPLTPGRAVIREGPGGARLAKLSYAEGRAVQMTLEGARWRLLDLE